MIISVPVSRNLFQSLAPVNARIKSPFFSDKQSSSTESSFDLVFSDVLQSENPDVLEPENAWNSPSTEQDSLSEVEYEEVLVAFVFIWLWFIALCIECRWGFLSAWSIRSVQSFNTFYNQQWTYLVMELTYFAKKPTQITITILACDLLSPSTISRQRMDCYVIFHIIIKLGHIILRVEVNKCVHLQKKIFTLANQMLPYTNL